MNQKEAQEDEDYRFGLERNYQPGTPEYEELGDYANVKLASLGLPVVGDPEDNPALRLSRFLIKEYREQSRLLAGHLCPADRRMQDFLDRFFGEDAPQLPPHTFTLDRHGLSRVVSLPLEKNFFQSSIIESYRVRQGVLHNPVRDRRTTAGVFHVTEGSLPAAADKLSVPKSVAAGLFRAAFDAPKDFLLFPFSAESEKPAYGWTSLLLRPVVCPEVDGFVREKSLETRFFAPASCVANLDFVESIFGNAGDPFLIENDAGLDAENWTGHTGCVVVAPHLTNVKKKDLGLPPENEASESQLRDGMFWRDPEELYNDGQPFKLTCRDASGLIFTVLADNYFGYCKKEVKTQISFSANLSGLSEEEHAGGVIVFPSYDLGEKFDPAKILPATRQTYEDNRNLYADLWEERSGGYAVDKRYSSIFYLPKEARFSLREQWVRWNDADGSDQEISLRPGSVYVLPSGYKVEMKKVETNGPWKLVGTVGEGYLCHKPCTVSGGGKSEISKPLTDAIVSGPVFVADWEEDMALAREILERDYSTRFLKPEAHLIRNRSILSPERSLGSVIKLLTPSETLYALEYNEWLTNIPQRVKDLVLIIKRRHRSELGDEWLKGFSVDSVNGQPANELRYKGQKLITRHLRVGFDENGAWRLFALRKDFIPAVKLIAEDDITASTVAPRGLLYDIGPGSFGESVKFVHNCEFRLFQRPDDAILRGFDKQTEIDLSSPGNFISNFQPLTREEGMAQVEKTLDFEEYTEPMQALIREAAESEEGTNYFVSSANPRLVDGKPSKNPRYLQTRPDLLDPRSVYIARLGTRMRRSLSMDKKVMYPVRAVLPGRRNNAGDAKNGIRPLSCFAPIHYLELPEFFMDCIASLTGKSPSTTGAGSEGAMTKGPFNAILPIHDLNAALVSYAATRQGAFVTSAGFIGPKYKVNHDVSLLIPEIWSRFLKEENDPRQMIAQGYLEPVPDFTHNGKTYPSSRLGYRITHRFAHAFLGRIFTDPVSVFPDEMLRPELQDADEYAESVANVVEAQRDVAKQYFEDGSLERACPPLRALLNIMAHGDWEGRGLNDPEFRKLFDADEILGSEWYKERLTARLEVTRQYWQGRLDYVNEFLKDETNQGASNRLGLVGRREFCIGALARLDDTDALDRLYGSLGTDPTLLPGSGE
jgi:hypothetical protein